MKLQILRLTKICLSLSSRPVYEGWFTLCATFFKSVNFCCLNKMTYKDTENKPQMELIDPYFEEDLAKILSHGADKYGRESWKLVDPDKYIAALQRHLVELKKGRTIDSDSGLPHASCIAANAMFLHYFTRRKNENTDV